MMPHACTQPTAQTTTSSPARSDKQTQREIETTSKTRAKKAIESLTRTPLPTNRTLVTSHTHKPTSTRNHPT
ncbi:hypothetical protein BS50DRAFT_568654 [Corynespora cassiicola Philippines]|uniref:Uncharacterized protein n=1 Tax=Corynespora cassiicola Philippines TaxID=1448308 RepID=A0A2T2P5X0_CORCC|nr:hypothetical protein BS50DRAFT_568654 [Corynespora cassiicola Philippines]